MFRCPIEDRARGGVGIRVEFGPSSRNRVRVELRLGLQVLLRVGYDPETVSESNFLEMGHGEVRAGAGAAAGIAGGITSGVRSSTGRRQSTPSRPAVQTHEPKMNVAPSSNLVMTEVQNDGIEINGGFSASSPTVGAKCRCFIPAGFSRGYPKS